jgi:hypothetical protein
MRNFLIAMKKAPHAEERPLRDVACGSFSGQGARLEARTMLCAADISVLLAGQAPGPKAHGTTKKLR